MPVFREEAGAVRAKSPIIFYVVLPCEERGSFLPHWEVTLKPCRPGSSSARPPGSFLPHWEVTLKREKPAADYPIVAVAHSSRTGRSR